MAKATKTKTKATKTKTKRTTSTSNVDALKRAREQHKAEREHVGGKLKHAHRAVLSVVDRVHADDREGIAKLRRAVEHADANASSKGGAR
jgi:hypothetical protein